jgi:GNAT superfamily N-acetyltransferase
LTSGRAEAAPGGQAAVSRPGKDGWEPAGETKAEHEMSLSSLLPFLPFQVHRFILHARDISHESNRDIPTEPFQFRELTTADVPLFARLVGEEGLLSFEERFSRGELCHGVFEDKKLVAFGWTSLHGGLDERTQLRIDLTPGQAYTYQFLVDPAYRNRGIGTALGLIKDVFLARQGVVLVFSAVGFRNYASRRALEKNRTPAVKAIYVVKILGKRFQVERRLSGALPKNGSEALTTRSKPE